MDETAKSKKPRGEAKKKNAPKPPPENEPIVIDSEEEHSEADQTGSATESGDSDSIL